MISLIRKFKDNNSGAVGILMGFILVILIGLIGLAIDVSRGALVKTKVEGAQNAALLAAGVAKNEGVNDVAQLDAIAQRYFSANYPDGYLMSELNERPVFDFSQEGIMSSTIRNLNVKEAIGIVDGKETIGIANKNTIAGSAFKGLDIVLLLDSSCSMRASFTGGGNESRHAAARRIGSRFVANIYDTIPNARVNVIAFDKGKIRLTNGFEGETRKDYVVNTIAGYRTEYRDCKTTTWEAMEDGRLQMRNSTGTKAVILVYDGAPTGDGNNIKRWRGFEKHQSECNRIRNEGNLLYTLFIGDINRVIDYKNENGKDRQKKVSTVVANCNPGENTFTAQNPAELEVALEKIADELSRMRVTE